MATSRDSDTHKYGPATSDRREDRTQIHRLLNEVGLNPADFVFSPLPDGSSPSPSALHHPSAFSSFSPVDQQHRRTPLKPQSKSLFTPSRPATYVQQPPPPPSLNYPPVPQPPNNREQGPAPPPPQASSTEGTAPQQGSAFPSFLFNRPPPFAQPTSSQSPDEMSQHAFSPRRLPPSPPHLTSHHHDSTLSAEHYLRQINSHDNPPVKVLKPSTQNVVYRKEIRIRYLQPPTPPPPAPIIIREKHDPPIPAPSPLLIRERKPEARTPPPLTIRERPPTPPAPLEPHIIEKNLPPLPAQPRQIIIERLPTPPPKPRTVIFEKWLPYKKVKRPVLLQKAPPVEPVKPTRNVIIEYEPLKAFTVRRVIEEGVFRVDPHQYSTYNKQSNVPGGDVRIVERIDDLPPPSEQLRHVLHEYSQAGQHSSPHATPFGDHHQRHNVSEHIPTSIQQLLSGGRAVSNTDQLTNVSRASSTPAYRHDRVLSTGYNSSNPSPTVVPLARETSHRPLPTYSAHESPIRSRISDIY